MKKEIVILGKGMKWGEEFKSFCQVHLAEEYEVWTLGTHPFPCAQRYYEFHGLSYGSGAPLREYIRTAPEEVYRMGVPVNNSIIALMLIAFLEGAETITLLGCPMSEREEYIREKPAVAECVGFLRGKGVNIDWSDEPKNLEYGRML